MGLKDFFNSLKSTPALLPQLLRIPNTNTDNPENLDGEFEPGKHYFSVRVNEMFLSQERKWFIEIEPSVICLTGYIYGEQQIDDPFIVGRNLIEAKIQNVPNGVVFRDTRVAGIHPFVGDRLIISLVLCQSRTENYIANTLDFIENVSGVLSENITNLVGNYVKIANVVIGGIDKLLNSKAITPLFGYRKEFDIASGDSFGPGFYVMIKSEKKYDANRFFVKGTSLYYGSDADTATEFRDTEYVMFSLTSSTERSDIQLLPFYQLYKKILDEIANVTEVSEDLKKKLSGMLRTLYVEMKRSPDLISSQAEKLILAYYEEVKLLINPKFNFGAGTKEEKDSIDEKLAAL